MSRAKVISVMVAGLLSLALGGCSLPFERTYSLGISDAEGRTLNTGVTFRAREFPREMGFSKEVDPLQIAP